jgi:putative transposase
VGNSEGRSPGRGERRLSHTSGNILLHLIFGTQGRRPLIKPDFRADLFAYLGGIVREIHAAALIINGTADHVHMLLRIRPAQSAAEIVLVVKANSSKWVRGKWSSDFAWQTGYGVFSVSESNVTATHGSRRGLHSYAAPRLQPSMNSREAAKREQRIAA